jgi:glycosyltransferase involved in cell wall biosynthesis
VELLEAPDKRQEMSQSCRRIAVEEYSLETLGRNYSQLYQKIAG